MFLHNISEFSKDLDWDEDNSVDDGNGDVLDDDVETTVYPCAKQPLDDLVLYFTNYAYIPYLTFVRCGIF